MLFVGQEIADEDTLIHFLVIQNAFLIVQSAKATFNSTDRHRIHRQSYESSTSSRLKPRARVIESLDRRLGLLNVVVVLSVLPFCIRVIVRTRRRDSHVRRTGVLFVPFRG